MNEVIMMKGMSFELKNKLFLDHLIQNNIKFKEKNQENEYDLVWRIEDNHLVVNSFECKNKKIAGYFDKLLTLLFEKQGKWFSGDLKAIINETESQSDYFILKVNNGQIDKIFHQKIIFNREDKEILSDILTEISYDEISSLLYVGGEEMVERLYHDLKELSKLQLFLNEQGGPENNGELFEVILEIQERFLENFSLPTNQPVYDSYLYFETPPTDNEIFDRLETLHKMAIEHISNEALTDIEKLQIAKEKNIDSLCVLAELSLPSHVYTIFVYEEILLKERDTIENVLHELNLVTKPGVLNALGKLEQGVLKDENEIIELLQIIGFKYIEQFVFFYKKNRRITRKPNYKYESINRLKGESKIKGYAKWV